MGLEGLTAARSRIAEISGRVGGLTGGLTGGQRLGGSLPTDATATSFDDVLKGLTASTTGGSSATTKATAPGDPKSEPQRVKFANDLLTRMGFPRSAENIRAISAWVRAEGTKAQFNPLATTRRAPDTTDFNSVGVKNYPSYEAGLDATVATLRNGRYANILAALAQGTDAMAVGRAVEQSPWGTGHGVIEVLTAE